MKVAWHVVPGKAAPSGSVPEGRCDWRLLRVRRIVPASVRVSKALALLCIMDVTRSYRPYGTGHKLPRFQALRARRPSGTTENLSPTNYNFISLPC